jgi:hypothetical protein
MPILIDKDLSAFPGDEKKNIVQHLPFELKLWHLTSERQLLHTRGLPIGKACDLKSKRDNSNFSKGRLLIMKLALHVHLLLLLLKVLLYLTYSAI